jgi:hypothetical protein
MVISCGSVRIGGGSFGYNLKGVTINPECKTANVFPFKNQAAVVQPMLSQKLTEKLKDKLLSQTHLKLTNGSGDITFDGTIESYTIQPMAPQAGSVVTAALNRLSVTIKVKYTNVKDSKWEYDTSFTRFVDYSANKNPSDIENSSEYDAMIDQLIQDIFDKAFVNW